MHTTRIWWGVLLIVMGLLFLLDTAGVWDFRDIFRTWWPALLILWGFLIIRRRVAHDTGGPGKDAAALRGVFVSGTSVAGDHLDDNAVFGDLDVRNASQNFNGGSVSTVFGNVHVDLSGVRYAEGEQTLTVSGVFGNVVVSLPPGQASSVSASTLMGSVRVGDEESRGFSPSAFRESPDYAAAPRKLRVKVSEVFGDLTVRN
jgi:predicted membrane protein